MAGGLLAGGAAWSQSTAPTAPPPYSPTKTPNDTSASQPGTPPAPGRQRAAPTDAPAGGPTQQTMPSTTGGHAGSRHPGGNPAPDAPAPGARTPANSSPPPGYPNTGGSK